MPHRCIVQRQGRLVEDTAIERRVLGAAEESDVHVLDLSVYDLGDGDHAPAVRLWSEDVASFTKNRYWDFLNAAVVPSDRWFVELYDMNRDWAWFGGPLSPTGSISNSRPDLRYCIRLHHSGEAVVVPSGCPSRPVTPGAPSG
jgi:hypothetical protein